MNATATGISWTRVRGISAKELTEFRRSGSIISTMAVIPLVFMLPPMVQILTSSAGTLVSGDRLMYLLGIPAIVPAVIAAYAVVGERQQGTLEPVLTTPLRREELLLGKAIAVLAPSLVISYAVYGIALALVEILAKPGVATAVLKGSEILAQVIFTPLVAGWAIWAGMAISTRARDVRVSQQLGTLVSLPVFAVAALIAFDAIHPSLGLALGLGAALVAVDVIGWRVTSGLFDRERLITGSK